MALGYRTFGRKGSQRKALFRDLITDLILNDFNINLKPYVKRVIKKAKNASNAKIPLSTAVSR